MMFMQICSVYVFGFLVYVTRITDCINGDSSLRDTLSEDQQNIAELCFDKLEINCDTKLSKYRPINGQCSVLNVPTRGMSETVFTRLLPALYKDDHSTIRTQLDGHELISPRVLSNKFFTDPSPDDCQLRSDSKFTLNMMLWGQVIAHETIRTKMKPGPSCCTPDDQRLKESTPNCESIFLPSDDCFYSTFKKTCMNMPRSMNTDDIRCCNIGPVSPINYNTCFLDGSLIYGSKTETNILVRSCVNGLLKYQEIDGNMYPPNVMNPPVICNSALYEENDPCFQTGDTRTNIHPMIAILQTVFLRLHNLLAAELLKLNPCWEDCDDKIFFETRRLIQAIIQQITFSVYVPNLIGKEHLEKINCCLVKDKEYNSVYDERINPQIMTEFIASFKALHSTIVSTVNMCDEQRNIVSEWTFSDYYNNIKFITKGNNFSDLVRGMTSEAESNMDRFFTAQVTDFLFKVDKVGSDLESLDIGKARDYGVNRYVNYLYMIGQDMPKSWDDLLTHMPQNMIDRLETAYDSYYDVELFIGGILEYRAKQSMLGPVFQAILAEQFCRMQKGDPYYFESEESPYPFTKEQLDQIRKVTLSFLYCYTCNIENIQPDAFRLISDDNPLIPCTEILTCFTLEPFAEC